MSDIYDILPTLGPMRRILEIGCSRMKDTARMRAMFPAAEIHCFEPDPRTVALIYREGLATRLGVQFYPVALSEHDGLVDFYLSTSASKTRELHTDSSSLRVPSAFDGTQAHNYLRFDPQPVKVQAWHLDFFQLWPVDFIWMDAQSAEDLIISGGKETFAETRYLYTEHNTEGDYENEPGLEGIQRLLPGWTVEQLWPIDVLLKNPKL